MAVIEGKIPSWLEGGKTVVIFGGVRPPNARPNESNKDESYPGERSAVDATSENQGEPTSDESPDDA